MPHMADYPKHESEYIDPNHLIGKGNGVTFIYTISGNLYTENSIVPHKSMLQDDKLWLDLISYPIGVHNKKLVSMSGGDFRRRAVAENSSILGRTGTINGKNIISFWGDNKDFLLLHIKKCIKKLLENNFIDGNTEVYTLIFKKTTVSEAIKGNLFDQHKNEKEYTIKGKVYTWEYLRDMRTQTHSNPNKENIEFLCSLLSLDVIKQYPELQTLRPTKCAEDDPYWGSKKDNLTKHLVHRVPNWGPIYPTIGDSTIHFKKWFLKEDN